MRKTLLLLTSMALAMVLAGGAALAVTSTGEGALRGAKGAGAALDRALEELVAMDGGPRVLSPSCNAARAGRSTPSASAT